MTLLYAQPVTRAGLLAAECAATLAGAVALVTAAGIAIGAGAAVVGADLGPLPALAGAWNVLPIVLLCLGAAVFALGWAPRAVAAIGALPAAGGFLLKVIADSVGAPAWVSDLSPFAHLALVPDASVNWPAAAIMAAIAVLGVFTGAVGYRRRDLRG